MTTDTPQIRPLAIIAGVACVVTALTILLGPSLFNPAEWTQYHFITVSVVFLTIAFLHLRSEAWANKRRLAACGFVLLAVVGTFLIVGQSVGRQVEATETEALTAEKLNERLATKGGELKDASDRLKYAEDRFEQESTGQKCLDRCNHWKRTATERRIVVKAIEAEIAALGPPKPVNAKAEAVADFLAVFGVDRKWTIGAYTLIEPFAKTLLLEFGSVLSFGYAFPHRPSVAADPLLDERLPTPEMFAFVGDLPDPTPPKPRKRKTTQRLPANVVSFADHPVSKALRENGGSVSSNRELARLMGVCDGEASKRWQEVAGQLNVQRDGKRLRIALL